MKYSQKIRETLSKDPTKSHRKPSQHTETRLKIDVWILVFEFLDLNFCPNFFGPAGRLFLAYWILEILNQKSLLVCKWSVFAFCWLPRLLWQSFLPSSFANPLLTSPSSSSSSSSSTWSWQSSSSPSSWLPSWSPSMGSWRVLDEWVVAAHTIFFNNR